MNKKKLKSLLITLGLSTAIITPLVLTSCKSDIVNNNSTNNNNNNTDNGISKKYNVVVEDDHKSDIKVSVSQAKENDEVTVEWIDKSEPKELKLFYTDSVNRSRHEIPVNGKSGKFVMPKSDVSIDVEARFGLSFKTVNNLGNTIDGATIKVNNQDYKEGMMFLEGEELTLSFEPKKEFTLEKVESTNNIISKDQNNVKVVMPKNNVDVKLTLKAKTTAVIKDLVKSALTTFDVWSFLPEKFDSKNKIFENATQNKYTENFVDKNKIQSNGVGIQFNQTFSILSAVNKVIKGADLIFNAANEIAELYQTYINGNPVSKEYESESKNVKFKISMNEKELKILAKVTTCSLEIITNLETNDHYGRIQLSNANAIKFEIKDSTVKFGLKALGAERMMVEIDKSATNYTIVKLYNFVGKVGSENEDKDSKLGLRTTSVLYFDKDYLSIMGKKGDFIRPADANRNMEVYDLKTGEFVTSKVYEYVSPQFTYLTNWYPLKYISGINSIKQDVYKPAEKNVINIKEEDKEETDIPKNSYYLNGNLNEKFKFKRTGFLGLAGTRIYDIELKDSIIYGMDNSKKDIANSKVTIPMLFIQDKYDNEEIFNTINDENKKQKLSLSSTFSKELKNKVSDYYTIVKGKYDSFESWMTTTKVNEYVGNQDAWLDKK